MSSVVTVTRAVISAFATSSGVMFPRSTKVPAESCSLRPPWIAANRNGRSLAM